MRFKGSEVLFVRENRKREVLRECVREKKKREGLSTVTEDVVWQCLPLNSGCNFFLALSTSFFTNQLHFFYLSINYACTTQLFFFIQYLNLACGSLSLYWRIFKRDDVRREERSMHVGHTSMKGERCACSRPAYHKNHYSTHLGGRPLFFHNAPCVSGLGGGVALFLRC